MESEFNEKELDNVVGGIPQEKVEEKMLEHTELYRQRLIEELKKEKAVLEQANRDMPIQGRNR